jgi:aldehyde:ferredoxin oxidoreductase
MATNEVGGYTGRFLRADLTAGQVGNVNFDASTLRKWVGGAGIGARILYDEVPPGVQWDDPTNRLILATGPLAGTSVMGSGTFAAVTVGPMTGGATSTQANGFLGAYMKFAGFDGVILQGRSEDWVYLYLHDGIAELRDARSLLGLDTFELKEALAQELGKKEQMISAFGVGPAGEHGVRFAIIAGDRGHVAGHNGAGAVMGSKRIKAVVAERSTRRFPIANEVLLSDLSRQLTESLLSDPRGRHAFEWGTSQHFRRYSQTGALPVRNYTTSVFPEASDFLGEKYRPEFDAKPSPCWACRSHHHHTLTVPNGPFAGYKGEEPEYEQWASCGPQMGNTDVASAIVIASEIDRFGMDTNETGWVMGWVMECYEKGILTKEDTDGLEMTWGNVPSIRALLRKIAYRDGIGDLLADGVRKASEKLGRGSEDLAVYTMKGNTPRSHDDRARWNEMIDVCLSDTGTIAIGVATRQEEQGAPVDYDLFDGEKVSEVAGKTAGRMTFEDCVGMCRFNCRTSLVPMVNAVAAATGWDITPTEAMEVGRRTLNLWRAFNVKRGLTPDMERGSKRYHSTPVDGPVAGTSIVPQWEGMRANYYRLMGWDLNTGRPLPETLASLGLPEVAKELWG